VKVVSGCDDEALDMIAKVYELVVKAGVHRASSIKVAEAAKVIENTQRDVNIALMNELSKIFDLLGINTFEVLAAAKTKWNFLPFQPGLVGGHCIGVDPYYLTYKSAELGYEPEVILSGRRINDTMASYVALKTVQRIVASGKDLRGSRVLIMGVTFKENVSDIRNSKIVDLVAELKRYGAAVDVIDPMASATEVEHEYGFALIKEAQGPYDAIVVAVSHHEYASANEQYFQSLSNGKGVIIDVKGVLLGKIHNMDYWSL
jgi:UDP-N-acetyl-D-galactosamine dehydrogenase